MNSTTGLSVRAVASLPGFTLDVGWTVGPGFTVLFGYSGAGKSLTLATIAGVMRPQHGRIRLGERLLFDSASQTWTPPQDRRIGYVSQGAQLFPHMTVRRNVEFALAGVPRGGRAERVAELLERFRVSNLADKRPHQLSGGQRQRAALARALAPSPDALLLDEPLSALDLPIRVEMRELLRQVQRELAIPVVMVTHDLYEACTLADTLVVYSGTGTVQTGTPRELVGEPATPEIRRLLHAIELPASVLEKRNGSDARIIPIDRKEHVA